MTKFDYQVMSEFDTGSTVFVGSKKKYPTAEDFIHVLEEKENFVYKGDIYDVGEDTCRYGYYSDEYGDLYNGYHYGDDVGGIGSFGVWILREEDGEYITPPKAVA